MLTHIVYYSKTGFTAQYAAMLAEQTGLPALALDGTNLPPDKAEIVFLSWLSAGSLKHYKKAAQHYNIKAVGVVGAGPDDGGQLAKVRQSNNIPTQQQMFYLQGGIDWQKMRGLDLFLMRIMRKFMAKQLTAKQNPTADEQFSIKMWQEGASAVSEEKLAPLVEWCMQHRG